MDALIRSARRLSNECKKMSFSSPVEFVYNPLEYAWANHRKYLELAHPRQKILFLGMNPGPFGMAQTGVPFGEVEAVQGWLKIVGDVESPKQVHPKRPVTGLECKRNEVSGQRLWGLFANRFGSAKKFFSTHFVYNYCPLMFLEESGRNRTPDKLPRKEQELLQTACDRHVKKVISSIDPKWVVAIGQYAEVCAKRIAPEREIFRILHPSPASPIANRGWAPQATRQMQEAGAWL